jgi:DNA-binding beta-propeller fold protein YncE
MMRSVRRILLTLGITAAAVTSLGLAALIYPFAPGRSTSVRFDGFIVLPSRAVLSVLDYMTLDGSDLYVAGTSIGSLFKAKIASSQAVMELPGAPRVHGVAFVPSKNIAFFTKGGDNTVGVLDPAVFKVLASIPVADDPDAILYADRANLIYVANGDAQAATLIDPDKRATVGVIPLGGKPEFPAIDPQDGLIYQNLRDTDSVVAVDLTTRSVVGRWSLKPCEGPSGMAIDSANRRLFSVCSGNAMLVAFDLMQHRTIAVVPVGKRPDSVAFDPVLRRIYVAGVGGTLTVIRQNNPDSYQVLENVSTRYGAHTLALDPRTHKVYVAYASLLAYPRIAVFSALDQAFPHAPLTLRLARCTDTLHPGRCEFFPCHPREVPASCADC